MIRINDKYVLILLKDVRIDNLKLIFQNKKVLYINNWPDSFWHMKHGINSKKNYSINKFQNFFSFFHQKSNVLSLTHIDSKIATETFGYQKVVHIGSFFKSAKISLLHKYVKSLIWLTKNHSRYEIIFVHNYQFPNYYVALFGKLFLKKNIIVDFEDDYYCLNSKSWQSILFFKIFRKFHDPVVAINENMRKYFNLKDECFYVFNGFIDMNYAKNLDFEIKDNMEFLISGTLNIERGIGLIPDIIRVFREKLNGFQIYIVGMKKADFDMNYPEIKFLGYLDDDDYYNIIEKVDVCLVLQIPDHPFNEGSFPSKIEQFSKLEKPIWVVKKANNE